MAKLRLGPIEDEKPVKLTLELSAALHRDLKRYGEAVGLEAGTAPIEPVRLIGPMLTQFMATDRGFARARRASNQSA